MTRLNKYLVYNPKADKPKKFFSNLDKAVEVANTLRDKERTDFLVLKVVEIAQCDSAPIKKIKEIVNNADFTQCQRCDGVGYSEGCMDKDCATYILFRLRELLELTTVN